MKDYKEDIGTTNRRIIHMMNEDICNLGFRIKKLETSLKRQTLRHTENNTDTLTAEIVARGFHKIEELEKKNENYLELIKYLCIKNRRGVPFIDRMKNFVSENGYDTQCAAESIIDIEKTLLGED